MKTAHEQNKPYKCGFCIKRFRSKSGLQGHINKIHEGKDPFQCNICEAGFITIRSLKYHTSQCTLSVHEEKNQGAKEEKDPVENDQEIEEIENNDESENEESLKTETLNQNNYWMKRMAKIHSRKKASVSNSSSEDSGINVDSGISINMDSGIKMDSEDLDRRNDRGLTP